MLDQFHQKRRDRRGKRDRGTSEPNKNTQQPALLSKRMVLDEKLKQAFCTQAGVSESQIDPIMESYDPK